MFRSDRLKELRIEKGWQQDEFAEKLGIARTTYAGYEQGRRSPDTEMVYTISEILKINPDYLNDRTDDRNQRVETPAIQKNDPHDVYADPDGWVDRLAEEYERKHNRKLEDWKRKAIMELLDANKPKPPEEE